MRRLIAFPCEGETLVGSLDEGANATGLLIVSGGNEIRAGAHRGMAALAARVAAAGYPVFRFDRRGIGDSTGVNGGFRASGPDLAAAAATFQAEAGITRVTGFGNCDAASALTLFGRSAGLGEVILANPWIADRADDLPPPAAIRARYRERLRDPAAWRRLLTGDASARKLMRGLLRIARAHGRGEEPETVAAARAWGERATVILAAGDATALAWREASRHIGPPHHIVDTPSHSFAGQAPGEALAKAVVEVLRK